MELNKKNLEEWKENESVLEMFKQQYREVKQKFQEDNEELIRKIHDLSDKQDTEKILFKEQAVESYIGDPVSKKLIGGIGIRIGTSLIYEEKEAYKYAVDHQLFLKLDQRGFEKFAKDNEIDFVTKKEKVSATFPKEIKFNEEE